MPWLYCPPGTVASYITYLSLPPLNFLLSQKFSASSRHLSPGHLMFCLLVYFLIFSQLLLFHPFSPYAPPTAISSFCYHCLTLRGQVGCSLKLPGTGLIATRWADTSHIVLSLSRLGVILLPSLVKGLVGRHTLSTLPTASLCRAWILSQGITHDYLRWENIIKKSLDHTF